MALQQIYKPWGSNLGVGSNTPDVNQSLYQQQYNQNLQNKATGQVLGAIGSGINKVGNFLGNPIKDWGVSENLERLGGMLNPKPAYANENQNNDLVSALVSRGGYSQIDAENAAKGPNADNLRNEFLGGGGGGGNGGGSAPKPYIPVDPGKLSNPNDADFNDAWKALAEAQARGDQAAIDQVLSQYGYNESELNRQLGLTDTYQGNALNSLLSQFQGVESDIGKQKTSANQTVDTEVGKASDQARMTQRQNRNVLRALGILGSTYAAENLAAPINQFDKQKATLVNWGNQRLAELDDYFNQKKSEYNNLVNDVKTKYADMREKIMGDLRYNNQQKAEAVKAATIGAQQNIANLNMQLQQNLTQLDQYRQGLNVQIAQMLMNKAPSANLDDIARQSIAFTNNLMGTSPNKQVAIYQGRSKAGEFDMNNYIGWDPRVAYQDWLSKNKSLTG